MREIKFRAWDNVEDKMYYAGEEENIHFYFNGGDSIAAERLFDEWVCTPEGDRDIYGDSELLEHLQYMQYTGFKDYLGNDIYEGDIVIGKRDSHWHGGYDTVKAKVCFSEYNLSFVVAGLGEGLLHNIEDLEVIGNIYGNPELLEGY